MTITTGGLDVALPRSADDQLEEGIGEAKGREVRVQLRAGAEGGGKHHITEDAEGAASQESEDDN